jgi:hypothetical protein
MYPASCFSYFILPPISRHCEFKATEVITRITYSIKFFSDDAANIYNPVAIKNR